MSVVAGLTLDEREALAESISPDRIEADRAAQDAADEQREQAAEADAQDIRDRSEPAQAAVTEALDDLLLAMSALLDAREKYASARAAGKNLQARARKLDLPIPVLDEYAERVLKQREVRRINQGWLELIHQQIR